jgi:protocatechuate 3,4-dioxygenase beta subunit
MSDAEQRLTQEVLAGLEQCKDPRLRQIMGALIRHLHAFVREVELTEAEWHQAIRFLTATGQMCDEKRQEFILLSDVLGVSMLVDAVNNRRGPGATESTVLGPFYVADAPRRALGDDICLDGKGDPLFVSGCVLDERRKPIAGASLDVWQAHENGFYDVQQPGVQPAMNLRGRFTADKDGRFWFRSVKPRHYSIPHDGPVGKLLATLGRHPNRPAHLHVIVSAPGFAPVTTHIFVDDDPYLASDAVFGVKSSLIGRFVRRDDPERAAALGLGNPFYTVDWDFRLERAASPA